MTNIATATQTVATTTTLDGVKDRIGKARTAAL
jgi:hypothetical protein